MNKSKDVLKREEFEKLWRAAVEGDPLDRLIFVCSGHLGMRTSEIAHMKKDWVDFQRKTVEVPEKDGDFQIDYGARSIPYKDLQGRVSTELRRFFDYKDAVGVSRATVFRRVRKMARRTSLDKKVYPRVLRATCAFQLAEAGINAQGLSQFMGWKELNTAQKYIKRAGIGAEKQIRKNKDKLW